MSRTEKLYKVAQSAQKVLHEIEEHAANFPEMRLPANTTAQNELRRALDEAEFPCSE